MNKVELADAVAQKVGGTRGDAEKVIAATVEVITEQLKAGAEVTITGFGQFSVSNRAARTGVNPQNPTEKIQIAATKVPKFKAGKGLKDAVRSWLSGAGLPGLPAVGGLSYTGSTPALGAGRLGS